MTPTEKAKELLSKFENTDIWRIQAKQCAIIAVQELKRFSILTRRNDWENWWAEVEQEIEKL
jgi:hypothetical protein